MIIDDHDECLLASLSMMRRTKMPKVSSTANETRTYSKISNRDPVLCIHSVEDLGFMASSVGDVVSFLCQVVLILFDRGVGDHLKRQRVQS